MNNRISKTNKIKKSAIICKICVICVLNLAPALAQSLVSNVRVQQSDEQIIVMYDLAERADIDVHVSFDGGATFRGPLKHVSGAVGRGIAAEKNKMLMWHVLPEVGEIDYDNVVIKVVAIAEDSHSDAETPIKKYDRLPPFMLAISFGARPYGTLPFGEITSGGAAVVDIDIVYFFSRWLGAGIKTNAGISQVVAYSQQTNRQNANYSDRTIFIGPSLYGRFGRKKLAFTTAVAAGVVGHSMDGANINFSTPVIGRVGIITSAGINVMLSENFGFEINGNHILAPYFRYSRKINAVGATMGINFRF